MKILIISGMAHYPTDEGIVGWGPTVEEINYLTSLFERITHIGFLYKMSAPKSSLKYNSSVQFIGVSPAGGPMFLDKLGILRKAFGWARIIIKELKRCDIVHVRCPSNIGLLALLLLTFRPWPGKKWVKYAGNWKEENCAFSYKLQRWLLHYNFHRGVVTINGKWPLQKRHEISFLNPSLTQEKVFALKDVVNKKRLEEPYQIIFVGRVEPKKGTRYVVEAVKILKNKGYKINSFIVGDGEDKEVLERLAVDEDIDEIIKFTGWLSHEEAKKITLESDFLVLPSFASEGWPKVLSEAMANGTLCIASNVSAVSQIIKDGENGRILVELSGREVANKIEEAILCPEKWKSCIMKAYQGSEKFTYEKYLQRIKSEIL